MKTAVLFAGLSATLFAAVAMPQAQTQTITPPPAPVLAPAPVDPPAPPARVLKLTFDGQGHATLVARNVTLRDILREWTRLGGSTFVNGDMVSSPAVSLEFDDVPETTILESLFRSTAGYIATPKLAGGVGASQIGAVYIVNSSHGVQTHGSPNSAVAAPLTSVDDEIPPVTPPMAPLQQPAQTTAPAASSAPPSNPGVYVPIVTAPGTAGTTGRGREGGGGR